MCLVIFSFLLLLFSFVFKIIHTRSNSLVGLLSFIFYFILASPTQKIKLRTNPKQNKVVYNTHYDQYTYADADLVFYTWQETQTFDGLEPVNPPNRDPKWGMWWYEFDTLNEHPLFLYSSKNVDIAQNSIKVSPGVLEGVTTDEHYNLATSAYCWDLRVGPTVHGESFYFILPL